MPKYFEESTFMLIFAADLGNDMERNLLIELLEDGEKVSLKNTATYEEDENLHRQVKLLQKIDIELKLRERKKVIVVTGTELLGELSFTIDDE